MSTKKSDHPKITNLDDYHSNTKRDQSRLVKSAILVTIEAIFCLGLIALIVAFINKQDNQKPNMYLLFGGFATVLISLLLISIILCMKCTDKAIDSKTNDIQNGKYTVHTIVGRSHSTGPNNNRKLMVSVISGHNHEKFLQFDHTGRNGGSITSKSEKSLPPNYYSLSNADKLSTQLSLESENGTTPAYNQHGCGTLGTYVTMSQANNEDKDYTTLSKEQVKKEYSELMRTPTVEEVRSEYFKFMDRQEHFQSLKKSIHDIRSNYDGNSMCNQLPPSYPNSTLRSQKTNNPSVKTNKSQTMQNSIYIVHSNLPSNNIQQQTLSKKGSVIKTNEVIKSPQQTFFQDQKPNLSLKKSPKNSIKSISSGRPSITNLFGFVNSGSSKNGSVTNKEDHKIIISKAQHFIQPPLGVPPPQVPQRNGYPGRKTMPITGTVVKNQNFNNRSSINSLNGPANPPQNTIISRDSLREHHERLVNLQSSYRHCNRFASIKSCKSTVAGESEIGGK